MARFTIRVQLDGYAKDDDYLKLHVAMKKKGFSRFITFGKNTYKLPHAEYNRVADVAIERVEMMR